MFAIIILMSFIPDAFPEFFGDWRCNGGNFVYEGEHSTLVGCNYAQRGPHSATTHWGFRHWMWFFCGVTLFIWNLVDLLSDEAKNKYKK